MQPKWLYKSTV